MATEDATRSERIGPHRTQLQQFWHDFRRNRLSLVGGAIIGIAVFAAILAPVLAPHPPAAQYDAPGMSHNPLPPGSTVMIKNENGQVVGSTTVLLGTDNHGRDILSRILFGLRTLLTVSLGVVIFSMIVGVAAGGVAGYYRNSWVDEGIMRFMDILFSFPSLILAIAVVGVLGVGTTKFGSFVIPNILKIVIVIGIGYIPNFARVMRGAVLREMEENYINAAKSIGAGDIQILTQEVAINTIPVIIVQATLYMATAILASAGLSFLGLGLQPPTSSLGLMLSNARSYIYSGQWWFPVFPGIGIMLIILGFNLLGDGLRDALDPRYTEEGRE
ncbi:MULTISPECIES: ABC transporter permease [unclassified Haladaptatus]|uniref:ABC transporter permease n=1 Tax=unclassified Haladaptatus TaxID=2622732 RepID=UPI00209C49B6|nr:MULTISPECIES: ABC transporter permease [unclassified Haladaptatus]MCO8243773.1 ABC transporter permease [Haladaptatus sp. AB643]MCO8256714.1 ABC transporter permease [Haladaptatus sp. AB618]